MRVDSIIVGALLVCAPFLCAQAQTATSELLEYEDVTIKRSVYPSNARYYWSESGELVEKPVRHKREWTLPSSPADGIVYGESVSRNEFGINGGVFPSPSGDRLAVYRKDERDVTLFPLLDIESRTGTLRTIRYPMNGMASERLSLCICDTLGNVLSEIVPEEFGPDRYLACVCWSPSGRHLFIQVLDRPQHNMHLNMYSAADGSFERTILQECNDAWVEPSEPLHFLSEDVFIYTTDNRDGYNSLYLCDTSGSARRLTSTAADVHFTASFPTGKKSGAWVYYTAADPSPMEKNLFRILLSDCRSVAKAKIGNPERLTPERGVHNVSLSPDGARFIDRWSNVETPGVTALRKSDGTLLEVLSTSPDPLAGYAKCEVEFGTVKSADGRYDNQYRLVKPLGLDPSGSYPLIVYVYGGPHSQMVTDSWLGNIRMWEMLMAQRGYAVYVQDNRGTINHGAEYEKAINRACGQVEMQDQIAGLDALLERCPWIDRERIGLHGWSYGGFMTISLAVNYPERFKVAVAGGPVIDWKWYEVMYGERYMDTPETNPEGFQMTSLMGKASSLTAKLLICQGAVDNTVVWENSLSFLQECIENDIQVDYFPYPCSEHNMFGKDRVHLYHKISEYFFDNL